MAPSIFTHIPSQKANKQKPFLEKKTCLCPIYFQEIFIWTPGGETPAPAPPLPLT